MGSGGFDRVDVERAALSGTNMVAQPSTAAVAATTCLPSIFILNATEEREDYFLRNLSTISYVPLI